MCTIYLSNFTLSTTNKPSTIFFFITITRKLILLSESFTRKKHVFNSVVDTVPYRPVRPKYTVPAGNPVRLTYLFRTGRNTGRTGLVPAVPANTGCTGRYLNTGPKCKKTGYVNFRRCKGQDCNFTKS